VKHVLDPKKIALTGIYYSQRVLQWRTQLMANVEEMMYCIVCSMTRRHTYL
jgi:hypothetical protein